MVRSNAEHAGEHLVETIALATALGRDLVAVRLAGLSTAEAAKAVTDAVVAWCRARGWAPELRCPAG